MSLFNSILTSFLILATFWGVALFQGKIAHAIQPHKVIQEAQDEVKKTNEVKEQTVLNLAEAVKPEYIHIAGIRQYIELADIQPLWQKFNKHTELHKHLKQQPKKVYVLYQRISKNYQQAEVTIGYDINEMRQFDKHYSIDISHNAVLLPAKKYNKTQLSEAWEKIDYKKMKEYVLEVHTLNQTGETTATQVFVSYQ
jgi:hypothetical protein